MSKKIIFWILNSIFLTTTCFAQAQPPAKHARIGFMTVASPAIFTARTDAFKRGLRELGYVEGKNITIEWRFAEGKLERQSEFIAEFVRMKVDAMVSAGPTLTRFAKEATSIIPIIMAQDNDPVGNGFVASLAHPGGNITGLSTLAPEIGGKRLEILKEVAPKLARVVVLGSGNEPGNVQMLKEMELAAKALRVQLRVIEVADVKEFEQAFAQVGKERADGILLLSGAVFSAGRKQVVSLARKSRLPAIHSQSEFVDLGGLMSYGVSVIDLFHRAATYVDKILKGAKPADLPVQQPTKFELIVNLKAAKQIGLTIPPNVLARADRVIR